MIERFGARAIAAIILGVFVFGLIVFGVTQCEKRRSQGAQSRVDNAQSGAQSNSAADAINTVAAAGGREAASEDLTRVNEREIRNAQGANERVGAGVNAAGWSALCKREAYRNEPRCKAVKP